VSRPETEATSPWAAPAEQEASLSRQRALRRAAERLGVLLLVAAVGVAIAGSVPTLARLLTDPVVPPARRGVARAMRSRGFAVAEPEPAGHPRVRGGALDPGSEPLVGELQDEPPTVEEPSDQTPQDLLELMGQLQRGAPAAGTRALGREALVLLDRADDDATAVLRLPPGALLRIEQSFGDWLQLSVPVGDQVVYGWARRARVVLLH
jgi:hypothetical protein